MAWRNRFFSGLQFQICGRDITNEQKWNAFLKIIILKEGVWRWERTASTFNYTNWGPNEPNNQYVEGCLELWTGTMEWNDYSCDGLKKYRQKPMCQKFI